MNWKHISLSLLIVAGFEVRALTLAPVDAPSLPRLSIDPNAPNIPCDQIVAALGNYNANYLLHNDAMAKFLEQLTEKITGWYGQLRPLEGTAPNIPTGTFSVLQDGAEKVGQLTTIASDNVQLISTELARIQDSLNACAITSKKPSNWPAANK